MRIDCDLALIALRTLFALLFQPFLLFFIDLSMWGKSVRISIVESPESNVADISRTPSGEYRGRNPNAL